MCYAHLEKIIIYLNSKKVYVRLIYSKRLLSYIRISLTLVCTRSWLELIVTDMHIMFE